MVKFKYLTESTISLIEIDNKYKYKIVYKEHFISDLFQWNNTKVGSLFYSVLDYSYSNFGVFDYSFATCLLLKYGHIRNIYVDLQLGRIYRDNFCKDTNTIPLEARVSMCGIIDEMLNNDITAHMDIENTERLTFKDNPYITEQFEY